MNPCLILEEIIAFFSRILVKEITHSQWSHFFLFSILDYTMMLPLILIKCLICSFGIFTANISFSYLVTCSWELKFHIISIKLSLFPLFFLTHHFSHGRE